MYDLKYIYILAFFLTIYLVITIYYKKGNNLNKVENFKDTKLDIKKKEIKIETFEDTNKNIENNEAKNNLDTIRKEFIEKNTKITNIDDKYKLYEKLLETYADVVTFASNALTVATDVIVNGNVSLDKTLSIGPANAPATTNNLTVNGQGTVTGNLNVGGTIGTSLVSASNNLMTGASLVMYDSSKKTSSYNYSYFDGTSYKVSGISGQQLLAINQDGSIYSNNNNMLLDAGGNLTTVGSLNSPTVTTKTLNVSNAVTLGAANAPATTNNLTVNGQETITGNAIVGGTLAASVLNVNNGLVVNSRTAPTDGTKTFQLYNQDGGNIRIWSNKTTSDVFSVDPNGNTVNPGNLYVGPAAAGSSVYINGGDGQARLSFVNGADTYINSPTQWQFYNKTGPVAVLGNTGNLNLLNGSLTASGLTVTNAVTFGAANAPATTNNLTVNGAETITGNANIGGTAYVGGNISIGGTASAPNYSISGATSYNNGYYTVINSKGGQVFSVGQNGDSYANMFYATTLNASGATALSGTATVGGTLGVTGATTLSSTLGVTGNSSLANVSASGTLNVTGASTLTGNTTVGGTLNVTGNTTLSNLTVSGTTNFTNPVTFNSTSFNTLAVPGTGTIGAANTPVTTTSLTVNGAQTITGNATVGGALTVTGTTNLTGTTTLKDATVNGALTTKGALNANGVTMTSGYLQYPNGVNLTSGYKELASATSAEISSDSGNYKTLMILGNYANGNGQRNIGMWDNVSVAANLSAGANLFAGGTITSGGNMQCNGAIVTGGLTTAGGQVVMSNNATVGGNLTVGNAANINTTSANTITLNGNVAINGTLSINGLTLRNVGGKLVVSV